jgi:hypothetical protein
MKHGCVDLDHSELQNFSIKRTHNQAAPCSTDELMKATVASSLQNKLKFAIGKFLRTTNVTNYY